MKKSATLAFWLVVSLCLSLVSCLGDNDESDNTITAEQYAIHMRNMTGTYHGHLYFYNDTVSTADKIDSVSAVASFTTDTIVSINVSPRLLVKNATLTDSLRTAIDILPSLSLSGKYYIHQVSDNIIYYGTYFNPTSFSFKNGGNTHTMNVSFYNYINLWGSNNTSATIFRIVPTEIRLDNTTVYIRSNSSYTQDTNSLLQFYGKK